MSSMQRAMRRNREHADRIGPVYGQCPNCGNQIKGVGRVKTCTKCGKKWMVTKPAEQKEGTT